MMYTGDSSFITGFVCVVLFIFGTIFGSAVNCMAGRIVAGEDWTKGRSHCEHCGHELGLLDLFPLLSYIFLGGKCRYCHKHISIRYFLVELFMGICFILLFLRNKTLDFTLVQYLILTVILFGLSLVDLDSYIIPDGFIIAGIINWLLGIVFVSDRKVYIINGLIGGFAIGGFILVMSLLMDRILKKESMGGGDIKLLFMVCLYTGPFKGLLLLFLSCLTGLLFVILLKERKIAFGPSISMATFFVLMWGDRLLEWYLDLF